MSNLANLTMYHPRLGTRPEPANDSFLRELQEGAKVIWQRIASMERILRRDKPAGMLPSELTAKPKGRGLTPRHELWAD